MSKTQMFTLHKTFIGTLHDAIDIVHMSKTRHTLPKVMMKDKQEKENVKTSYITHICITVV